MNIRPASAVSTLIAVCISLNVVGLATARRCYSCSTVDGSDTNCEDHFTYIENSTVRIDQECDSYCIKHEVHKSTLVPSIYRSHAITRTCGSTCLDLCTDVNGLETCIYCCLEDLCNSSPQTLHAPERLTFVASIMSMIGMLRIMACA